MSESYQDITGSPPQPPGKGRRWGEDETVPTAWVLDGHALRKQHRLPRIALTLEAIKFANYWVSATGKNASKLNWKRTWLNWCISARGEPEAELIASATTTTDNDKRNIELALKGIRTLNFGPDLIRRCLEKGFMTPEQAKKLGY